jgi:hypothetical protein
MHTLIYKFKDLNRRLNQLNHYKNKPLQQLHLKFYQLMMLLLIISLLRDINDATIDDQHSFHSFVTLLSVNIYEMEMLIKFIVSSNI